MNNFFFGPFAIIVLVVSSAIVGGLVVFRITRHSALKSITRLAQKMRRSELGAAVFGSDPGSLSITTLEELAGSIDELMRLHDMLTTNIAASVVILNLERRVIFGSPFTTVLTGWKSEELLEAQDPLLDMVEEEDQERFIRAWNVCCLGEEIHVRYRVRHRSGLLLWLETRFVPIHDEEDRVSAVLGVTIDLTDTMDRQRQIEEKNRDLEDFTYMVSHDLKAPIFTMKGMATILQEDFSELLGDDGNEHLRYIVGASERLERMIASVLAYSRLATERVEEQAVSLGETIGQVREDLSQLIKDSGGAVSVDNLPTIWGDPVRVYQVFSNLIGNALKYRHPDRPPQVRVRSLPTISNFCSIEVSDNGSGIPEQKLNDIFRPYHRAHGADIEGHGIGLACVKKIVESMGGAVTVRSTPNEGTSFTVALPLAGDQTRSIPEDLRRAYHEWT